MARATDETLLPVLAAALEQARSAACITTADLDWPGPRIVYVNPAYSRMIGRSADEVVGQTPRIMQGPLTDRSVLDRMLTDLGSGRPFVGETVNYRKDGKPFLISWRIDPVLDAAGNTTHYVATQEDITRLRRAEQLLAAEQAIDRSVSALLRRKASPLANLDTLAADLRDAVRRLIDYGDVAVTGSMQLGTSTATFGAGVELADDTTIETVLAAGPDRIITGVVNDRNWLGCPLGDRQTGVEGAIVVTGLNTAQLDFIDTDGLTRVAECAGRALHSVAEYERHRLIAIELQRDLLPAATPEIAGLRLSAGYRPGAFATRVGGDWYDVFEHDERAVLIVGDMAGSGVRAAADMGRVRLLIRALLQQNVEPPQVFAAVNRFCVEEELVATALAVIIDTETAAVQTVSAGHLPPVIRRASGSAVCDLAPGPLLGIGGDADYPVTTVDVEVGDLVLLFTDGLVERPGELIDVSLARLADELLELPRDTELLSARLLADPVVGQSSDDVAVLAVEIGFRPSADRAAVDS